MQIEDLIKVRRRGPALNLFIPSGAEAGIYRETRSMPWLLMHRVCYKFISLSMVLNEVLLFWRCFFKMANENTWR